MSRITKRCWFWKRFPNPESRPYAFDGRPYQRIGSTTSIMPQTTYQRLLNERTHSRIRWENQAAEGCEIADMDSEEILRTVRLEHDRPFA